MTICHTTRQSQLRTLFFSSYFLKEWTQCEGGGIVNSVRCLDFILVLLVSPLYVLHGLPVEKKKRKETNNELGPIEVNTHKHTHVKHGRDHAHSYFTFKRRDRDRINEGCRKIRTGPANRVWKGTTQQWRNQSGRSTSNLETRAESYDIETYHTAGKANDLRKNDFVFDWFSLFKSDKIQIDLYFFFPVFLVSSLAIHRWSVDRANRVRRCGVFATRWLSACLILTSQSPPVKEKKKGRKRREKKLLKALWQKSDALL